MTPPVRLAVASFDAVGDLLHRRHVGAVSVEDLVAQGKALPAHDERDRHPLPVRGLVAAEAPLGLRVALGGAPEKRARRIVEQEVVLESEELAGEGVRAVADEAHFDDLGIGFM
jgi:hypothetical protein